MSGRVRRLSLVSSVALGVIWWLAHSSDNASPLASAGLLAGWVLMPVVLITSLRLPLLKYGLVAPSTLVLCALFLISSNAFPSFGWLALTSGVALGGLMGAWFWFRWAPIPHPLQPHNSRGRITLIAVHVTLILSGTALVALE